jgi:Uncharacterized protein conserved in bacteria
MSATEVLEPIAPVAAHGETQQKAVIVVFDRDGEPRPNVSEPDVIIEPENFLVDDVEHPMAQRVKRWLQEHQGVPALGICFPKFTDGRGFSVAARLREAGYQGELHALGAISQDLVFQLRRVGFTHFHLENPGVERIERRVLEPFSGYYQAGADGSRAFWQAP